MKTIFIDGTKSVDSNDLIQRRVLSVDACTKDANWHREVANA